MRAFIRRRPHRVGGFKLVFGVGRKHIEIRLANRLPHHDRDHPHGCNGHFTQDGWLVFFDWAPWHARVAWHNQRRGWTERRSRSSPSSA